MKEQIKCPKCGDSSQTEVTRRWGNKIEICCDTCGQVTIIQKINDETT